MMGLRGPTGGAGPHRRGGGTVRSVYVWLCLRGNKIWSCVGVCGCVCAGIGMGRAKGDVWLRVRENRIWTGEGGMCGCVCAGIGFGAAGLYMSGEIARE